MEEDLCGTLLSMEEMAKAYDPKGVEGKLYAFWEKEGLFSPRKGGKKYSIVIPPPNVTGVLHMGHALVDTVQDILIRYKRMMGFETVWYPGTDHAGIATQTVVERDLIARTGKRRVDFERNEFLRHVWEWKEKSESHILHQIKQLGCSCDWSKLAFTLDETRSKAVRTVFKKMFDEGLIYRGDYLVNWDPVTETALADDEVEYEEKESFLWHFTYPLADGSGNLEIATTRPETMLGDTAVAVAPKDERYKHLIGKTILLPIMNREIPIIADHYVDPEFGTGVVKITPAHDPNDYAMGQTHDLPMINILTSDAKINENGGEFQGMSVTEAREAVVKKMQELGHFVKAVPHTHRVGVSYRSKAVIEPFLSKQWFIKMEPFKQKLIDAVKEKKVKLIPENWENTYFHWIENLRDWCISRQLWWGHQIPIWYKKDDPSVMVCESDGLPAEVEKNPDAWEQDPDVLDTWFSSALWPFSLQGWPDQPMDFYPTSVLVTGHDILFFWVARMIMMGEYITGKVPFTESFLHGLIYGKSYWREGKDGGITYLPHDEKVKYDLGEKMPKDVKGKWEKMSKSKGNIIDPLEMIDAYGADALRMALACSCTHARQIDLDRRRFEEFKNFANKVWNATRFIFMNLTISPETLADGIDEALLSLPDKWILSRLAKVTAKMHKHFENYHFDRAATDVYSFFWDEFCAYYLELVKPILFGDASPKALNVQRILVHVLLASIRLMHPIAPFITEEIFQKLKEKFPLDTGPLSADACIVADYPKADKKPDEKIEEAFETGRDLITTIRNIRAEMKIPPKQGTDLYIAGDLSDEIIEMISALVKIDTLRREPPKDLPYSSSATLHNITLTIPLPKELQAAEKERLIKEREKLETQIASLKKQLSNPNFVDRAPPALVEKTKNALHDAETRLASF